MTQKTHYINIAGLLSLAVISGCMGDSGTSPMIQPPAEILGSIIASPSVVILAVGGTGQLNVTPRSLSGDTSIVLDSIVYRAVFSADTASVRISSTGELTAVQSTPSPIRFNVFGYKGKAIKADQAFVYVTETAVPGMTLSIQPGAGDSAKLAMGVVKQISAVLRNPVTGEELTTPPIRYRVKPEFLARVGAYQPRLTPPGAAVDAQIEGQPTVAANEIIPKVGEGSAWIFADVNAYGTVLRDSVLYTFSYPYSVMLAGRTKGVQMIAEASDRAENRTIIMAPGATLTFIQGNWESYAPPLTVSFSGPSVPAPADPPSTVGGESGDIIALRSGESSARRFLVPGTYTWTMKVANDSTSPGYTTISGTILIK